jgi:lipopolysaccharide export system protein LptA
VAVNVTNPDNQSATLPGAFAYTSGSITAGCGAGTDNSDCGNVGDPYEGQGPPSNQVPISACGTTISASGKYKVTQDIGSDATATCITITYNTNNVNLDLGGHSVTGMIFALSGNGNTIYNGTVTCNKDTSTYPQTCVQVYAQITTAQWRAHHLTLQNQHEAGGVWALMTEMDNPATYAGGGSGLGMPCRIDHISATSITGTGIGNRYGFINNQGYCNVEEDHNYLHCTGGSLQACQGMGAGDTSYAYIHDNYILLDPVSSGIQDGRGLICDAGAGVNGTCDIYNNSVTATNNRAIRFREFPPASGQGGPWGIQHGNVYNNVISNIQEGGRLAAIHIGENDNNLMTTAINIYGNTLELNNGNGVVVVSANGVTARDNTFTCYGGSCVSAGWPLFTDALGYSSGQTNASFKNNTIPVGITNSVKVCGPPGNPSYACSAPAETTSATVCNTGGVVGNGTITTLSAPCP